MNRLKMLLSLAGFGLLAGCYKDKGNYDYTELNEISISTSTDIVNVKQFDTLKIDPVVTLQDQSGQGKLKYSWYYLNQLNLTSYEISKDKNIRSVIGATPGTYELYLKVTDSSTGVGAFHKFQMQVTSNLPEGWLFLYEAGADSSDAALILPSGQILADLHQLSNQKRIAGQPRQIVNYSANWNKQYIFTLTSKGYTYINPLDFKIIVPADSAFYSLPPNLDPVATFPNPGTWFFNDYLFNGKKLYVRQWPGPMAKPYFGAALEGDYQAAPWIMGTPYDAFGGYPAVIYDEAHSRFMYLPPNQTTLTTFSNTPAAFNMNNMGGKKLLFAHNTEAGFATALFQQPADDSLFIYRMDFGTNRANTLQLPPPVDSIAIDLSRAPEMKSASLFDLSPDLPLLYYAVSNKLYKYDLAGNFSTLIYTFPAGASITAINMLDPQKYKPYPLVGRRFAVATLENGEGILYDFPVAPTGSFTGDTYQTRYSNSFGKITSINYKVSL
ncbi:MAG: PKD-like family lipoprotein [Candidatus Pseudobacter hemicellulosilyticus]|uniref:PKD-like family lipoprotein n=1 Tax=Candidatus Pseudobacter hemicellulosilyticus TaxID=3121375 RepID=A0AAJ6BH70_9BACT|nr:MAG: PKD-like family lipoprotein [Pseudobacter sp.]